MLIISSILLAASIVLAFLPSRWSVVAAWAGLLSAAIGVGGDFPVGSILFWGITAIIVLVIDRLLPVEISRSSTGNAYIAAATLAGALVGMVLSHAAMIVGAVTGAFCGALAYSRTPAGIILAFPSAKFLNYLCAKGLPAIITMCTVGTAVGFLAAEFLPR